ncbi:MAG: hypothetical protein AAF196_01475 [Planctomycetota bacterium]
MKLHFLASLTLCVALSPNVTAQQAYNVEQERVNSVLLMFDRSQSILANVSINYGQPEWKAEYAEQMEDLHGRDLRLGKDWWTTLVTATPLEFGNQTIAPGVHYLGLRADDEGQMSLLVFDIVDATKRKMVPWDASKWKGGVAIPLELDTEASEKPLERMSITMSQDEEQRDRGRFSIRWGTLELSSSVEFGKLGRKK